MSADLICGFPPRVLVCLTVAGFVLCIALAVLLAPLEASRHEWEMKRKRKKRHSWPGP